MARVPAWDERTQAILDRMKADEVRHAQLAKAAGGAELPAPIKLAMRLTAKVMTGSVYWM
jgi:ubiquinone biosynthesis monooxygenase Coq7